jgi:hypothetical protein
LRSLADESPETFAKILKQVYGGKVDAPKLATLVEHAKAGRLPLPADVRFVDRSQLGGANAAYAAERGGRIFIAADLVDRPQELDRALTEEVGHHLDRVLGGKDTRGDEGQAFRIAVLKGAPLTPAELAAARADADQGKAVIAGRRIDVEFDQPTSTAADPRAAEAAAEKTVFQSNPRKAVADLAAALRHRKPAERDALVQAVLSRRYIDHGARALREAHRLRHLHGDISKNDREVIARSLGDAYERGAIDESHLATLFQDRIAGAPWESPVPLGDLIARSGSERLQMDAALELLSLARSGTPREHYLSYFSGAAKAASGSPAAAASLLGELGTVEQLDVFLARTRPSFTQRVGSLQFGPGVLGDLVGAAARIKPPSEMTNALFDRAVGMVDGDHAMREGLASFFRENAPDVAKRLAATEGDVLAKEAILVRFAEDVLFADPFEGQDELRQAFAREINGRMEKLRSGSVASAKEGDEIARQVGFLVGGAEVGFRRALENARDANAAREAMAGFIFDATIGNIAGAIPFDVSLPGVGSLKGKATDKARSLFTAWVQREEPDAKELTEPFYRLALQIPGDYHDEMKAIRGSFFDDELMRYLDS